MKANVRSLDIPGKAFCAMSAHALNLKRCDHRTMVKQHPKRPNLRAWREHFGKTQEWLANAIGTSHTTVLRHERQETGVNEETFQAIAAAYGISPAELTAHPSQREKAQQLDRLLLVLREMDAEALKVIAGFAERMKPTK